MQKTDYQKQLDEVLKNLGQKTNGRKPTLLLHACCAPCSSYVIEYLSGHFAITIFYYNPNIHPRAEYERRLAELKKFLTQFPPALHHAVNLVVADYNPEDYFEQTNVRSETALQTEPEKGERCRRCYAFRMKKAWEYACARQFDWFTTTLSISPHKDAQKINTIGRELASDEKQTNDSFSSCLTQFLPADFKKKGGFLRSTKLSAEYDLWRQDYCGCVYSQKSARFVAGSHIV